MNPDDDDMKTTKQLKFIFIGPPGAGKTSIIRRYTNGTFSHDYRCSIGLNFSTKQIKLNDQIDVDLQLWDIAGQDRNIALNRDFFQYSVAAFIVADITDTQTIKDALLWKEAVCEKAFTSNNGTIPSILLANKVDLISNDLIGFIDEDLNNFYSENGFLAYYKTSAYGNIGLDDAILDTVNYIINNNIEPFDEPNKLEEKKESGCRFC